MFTHRTTIFPAAGKNADVRALLEERVRERQSAGSRASVARTLYGEASFALLLRFNDLGARDDEQIRPIPGLAPLLHRPSEASLHEVLVPSVRGDRPVKYVEVYRVDPLSGKTGVVRSLLMKRVDEQLAQGDRVALSVEMYGQNSGVFAHQAVYESFAELEGARARRLADEGFLKFGADLAPLVARRLNTAAELVEVLIPFPPRD